MDTTVWRTTTLNAIHMQAYLGLTSCFEVEKVVEGIQKRLLSLMQGYEIKEINSLS